MLIRHEKWCLMAFNALAKRMVHVVQQRKGLFQTFKGFPVKQHLWHMMKTVTLKASGFQGGDRLQVCWLNLNTF